MNLKKYITLLSALTSISLTAFSAENPQDIKNVGQNAMQTFPKKAVDEYFYATPEQTQWFRDAKFAVFVHWNPSSLVEAEISWGRKGLRPGLNAKMANPTDGVPAEKYDNLYKSFNPSRFNADEWIKLVKDAGAKYFIFTTKHHDGFCMFDAKNTTYKITNTPFGRDVCKEIADACHKYDIKLFWYYSQPDWTQKDYLTKNHDQYRKYMYEHIRQLLTDYGKIDGMWFDCLNLNWKHLNSPEMIKMIRELQPGILINSRWGWGMPLAHNGDFDNPEQKLGTFKVDRPWETCATMGQGWSWRGIGGLISKDACIKMLVQCVGAGGNLALDCGPRPDGLIDIPERSNYLAMGKWLKKNGESIYGTRGGPYKPGVYGVSCHKGNNVYLHVLASIPTGKSARIELPKLPLKILKAHALSGEPVEFKIQGDRLTLDLSKMNSNEVDKIVVLELAGDASSIQPIDVGVESREVKDKSVKASSFYDDSFSPDALLGEKKGEFHAGIHHSKTWVAKGANGAPQWVEFTFKKPERISAVSLAEPNDRQLIREFVLEASVQGKWKPIHKGKTLGSDFTLIFPPVKAEKIRLRILKYSPNDPGLQKFKVYRAQ